MPVPVFARRRVILSSPGSDLQKTDLPLPDWYLSTRGHATHPPFLFLYVAYDYVWSFVDGYQSENYSPKQIEPEGDKKMETYFDDYYMILGVKENAGSEEIKKAYKRLCKAYHPDEGAADDTMFKVLQEMYITLSDPQKRTEYDRKRKAYSSSQGRAEGRKPHSEKQDNALRDGLYRKAEELRNRKTEAAFGAAAVLYGSLVGWKDADIKKEECLMAEKRMRDQRKLRQESEKKEAEKAKKIAEELKRNLEEARRETEAFGRKAAESEKKAGEQSRHAEKADKELRKANGRLEELKKRTVIIGGALSAVCILLAGCLIYLRGNNHIEEREAFKGETVLYTPVAATDDFAEEDEEVSEVYTRQYIVAADKGVNVRRADNRKNIVGALPAGAQIVSSMDYDTEGWVRFDWNGMDVVVYEQYLHRIDKP